MIDTNHPKRRRARIGDTASLGGAFVWLGVTLLGIAVLVRTVLDMTGAS